MIQRVLAIWSLVPLPFFKSSLNTWKFLAHELLKPSLESFEHYFVSVWNKCGCTVVWMFFGIDLWDCSSVPGKPSVKSLWPSRSDSLGIPSPFVGSSGWKSWLGVQNVIFNNSVRTSLVLLFSSLWVTYPAVMGFDFTVVTPLLPSHCGFFVYGCGVSLLVFSSNLLWMVVQQLVVIFVLSQEEMSIGPSTPTSWTASICCCMSFSQQPREAYRMDLQFAQRDSEVHNNAQI